MVRHITKYRDRGAVLEWGTAVLDGYRKIERKMLTVRLFHAL